MRIILADSIVQWQVADNPAPIDLYTYDIETFSIDLLDGFTAHVAVQEELEFFSVFAPKLSKAWRSKFQSGLTYYLDGEWEAAQAILDECLHVHSEDVPAKVCAQLALQMLAQVSFELCHLNCLG